MRGKISEAEKSLIRKLYAKEFTLEDISTETERGIDTIKSVLGLEVSTKSPRMATYSGFDTIEATLDRGQVKFYLPKNLTAEDLELIVTAMYDHFDQELPWGDQDEDISLPEPTKRYFSGMEDRYAMMRQIIEAEDLVD